MCEAYLFWAMSRRRLSKTDFEIKEKKRKKRPLFRRLKTTKKNVSFPINCGSGLQISFPLHPTISVWVPVVAFLVSVLDVFLQLEHTSRF